MKGKRDTPSKYKVPNLERALVIIEHLAEISEGLGLTELARDLGFPKNSVFRIAMTLQEHGYLTRDEATRRFRVSRKLLALGQRVVSDRPLIPFALDIMRECRDMLRETVLIGTLVEDEGVIMEQVLGTHPFKFSLDPGMRFKLHVAAPGKAMLAYLPESERNALLARLTFTRYNERTITTRKALEEELQRVRECGFALDREEQFHGTICIGAPIFNRHGYPVAAIWTTGPTDRIAEGDCPRIGAVIRSQADRISKRLGHDLSGAPGQS